MKTTTPRVTTTMRVGLVLGALALGSSGPYWAAGPSQPDPRRSTVLTASAWQGILSAYERHRYGTVPAAQPGHWLMANPGQQWNARFDGRGFSVEPDERTWTWGLELRSYGVVGVETPVGHRSSSLADGNRVRYHWDDNLEEWFINDRRGLEHGFTVRARPTAAAGSLSLTLAVRGGLTPAVAEDGRQVAFTNARHAAVVTYSGLTVVDATGRALDARFHAAGDALQLTVDDAEAAYPLTIDPVAQQAYLKASNTGADDAFGASVAISGDLAVVGAPGEDSDETGTAGTGASNGALESGAAYVFVRDGGVWSFEAYLKASNTEAGDAFGTSVGISGDADTGYTVVVGAPLESSSATGVDGAQGNGANNSGAAYVYVRSGTAWIQQAYLKASNTGNQDRFGLSAAISGDTIVIGAPRESSAATGVDGDQLDDSAGDAGAAYVFVRSSDVWAQQAYLKAANTGADDRFGGAVSVSGDIAVIGAVREDGDGDTTANAGAAYVFVRNAGVWNAQATLRASNAEAGDSFGTSVSVSGTTIVVGADQEKSNATTINGDQGNNAANNAGAAYVYVANANSWLQQAYLKASNTNGGDRFGAAVAASGELIVVGALGESSNATGVGGNQNNNGANNAGAAYLFVRRGSTWSQDAYLKASNTEAQDRFAFAVAVDANTAIAGAVQEDSSTTGVGTGAPAATNNSASNAGAAYVFYVPADLVQVSVSNPPASPPSFGPINITDTVRNDGPGPSGEFAVTYYFSENATLEASDVQLYGARALASLAPGASSTATSVVWLPAGVPSATYYLLACADADAAVAENSESNNCAVSSTTIRFRNADLTVSALGNPPTTFSGAFSLSNTVRNSGGAPAAASQVGFFLSTDLTLDQNDIPFIATRAVPALNVGATSAGSVSLTVPAGTAPGTYRILACADVTTVVPEESELNNCRPSVRTGRVP